MNKWTSIFTSEEITLSIRREWQIALAGIDAKVVGKALEMITRTRKEWPPTSMQFAETCRSIERDQRMLKHETKQIGNHNPEFAKQQLHNIMLKLKPVRINVWQRVHGMRVFV